MKVNWKNRKRDFVTLEGDPNKKITELPERVITPPIDESKNTTYVLREIIKEKKQGIEYAVQPHGGISLTANTSTVVMHRNPERKIGIIVNDSAAVIYLALGPLAIVNTGIRLNANGGAFWFGLLTDTQWTGEITAISNDTASLTFVEAQ
jgi:hypothetical protein